MQPHYDPFTLIDDPYPCFRDLRDHAPVYRNEERGFWAISRFDDVRSVARETRTFRSEPTVDLDDAGSLFHPGSIVDSDPPLHDRLRGVLQPHFRPKDVREALEPIVRREVTQLIDRFIENGSADLVDELARPLPATALSLWLGFPRQDHDQLGRWFQRMCAREVGAVEVPVDAWKAREEYRAYLLDLIAGRGGADMNDLLAPMIAAQRAGDLSTDEVVGMSLLVFFAGNLTTVGNIGIALRLLAEHPDQRALLAHERERISDAVEETLRFDAPLQWLGRTSSAPARLHDVTIPSGERVILLWASANRDERHWDDPDRFDVTREPKRHLAFGEGIHHCLGKPLAQLETKVVLEEVLARLPDYEISGEVRRQYSPGERGLLSLPVSFAPAPRTT